LTQRLSLWDAVARAIDRGGCQTPTAHPKRVDPLP
jgi:hypothetical protein